MCAIMKLTLTWGGNNWIRSQEDRDRDSSEGTEERRGRERGRGNMNMHKKVRQTDR